MSSIRPPTTATALPRCRVRCLLRRSPQSFAGCRPCPAAQPATMQSSRRAFHVALLQSGPQSMSLAARFLACSGERPGGAAVTGCAAQRAVCQHQGWLPARWARLPRSQPKNVSYTPDQADCIAKHS